MLISMARQSHATNSKSNIPVTRINEDDDEDDDDGGGGDDDEEEEEEDGAWLATAPSTTPLPSCSTSTLSLSSL